MITAAASGVVAPAFANQTTTDEFDRGALMPGLKPGYLNNAGRHLITAPAAQACADYARGLVSGQAEVDSAGVRAKLARLIGANDDEIVYTPSTSMGEYLVTQALDLPARGGRIITDALHFVGSFYNYEQLGKQGMDVVILPMQDDGSVSIDQYSEAITDDTRLIAVSHVSWVNGFQHDLKALSDLAHAHGAYLCADIIQSAGNTPVDVKAMGVDFASCGAGKWLMGGDSGLSFLYANSDLVGDLVPACYGYLQTRNFVEPKTHLYPFDEPGTPAYISEEIGGVGGVFNGTVHAKMIEAGLSVSLDWILETGVENLQANNQPMIEALQVTLRDHGFRPYTPMDSTAPIVSFIMKDARGQLNDKLKSADVKISTYGDRFRISPSWFNNMNDIDRVIEVIGRA
jgi:selenocysteine lyase/cysteine desulfurase